MNHSKDSPVTTGCTANDTKQTEKYLEENTTRLFFSSEVPKSQSAEDFSLIYWEEI